MRNLLRRRDLLLSSLPLTLAACGASDKDASTVGTSTQEVELFSWWIAPSEADALDALIALHRQKYPNERVFNGAVESGAKAKEVLAERIAAKVPPDLYQENAYNLPVVREQNPGSLLTITELFDAEGLRDVLLPEVIDDVTIDGEIAAMPVNVHRENSLIYNQHLFEEQGLEVPTTLDEFFTVCDALKAAGITPLATSHTGWIQRILFNSLTAASMGAEAYRSYFLGESELDEPALREAIGLLDRVLTSYVNDSASDVEFGWTDCADLLFNGQAAMFIHGDWAKGYFTSNGWDPGTSFGVVGTPGAADLFLYGVDVLALLDGAKSPEAAQDFLRVVASKEGQVAFNKIKGSTPIRLDVDSDDLDVVAQATLKSLRDAKLRMLTRSKATWDAALEAFAASRDVDALIAAYRDNPPGA